MIHFQLHEKDLEQIRNKVHIDSSGYYENTAVYLGIIFE
jgi:hypothetical protein